MKTGDLVLERYTLVGPLGSGGFGETWSAERLGDRFVVKFARIRDDQSIGRELQALRHLVETSGVAKSRSLRLVRDVGIHDGLPVIVYPWIEGETLERVLGAEGRLAPTKALTIALALADGLATLHAERILHRDIKPSNILLPSDPQGDGEAVLLDFGVAGEVRQETGTTVSGEIFGTPYYMAPEQVSGRPQSTSADIYGLGTVLYEMLYGRPPFLANNVSELLLKVLSEPVVFDKMVPVPHEVRRFVGRCLEKDPQRRPANGAVARDEIDRLLRGRPLVWAGTASAAPSETTGAHAALSSTTRDSTRPIAILLFAACLAASGITLALKAAGLGWASVSAGCLFGTAGLLASRAIGALIADRKTSLARDSEALHGRAMTRDELSQSIAIDLSALIARCEGAGERILGQSIALMIREYGDAKDFDERQKALMSATQLLEKLNHRLSPWYVRNEKLLPTVVGIVGVVSAVVTMVLKLVAKK